MALPTNKLTKVKLPDNTVYEIIPKTLRDGTTNYKLSVPTLTADSTVALSSDIKDGILTLTQNEINIGTFSANASSNVTLNVVTPKVFKYI